MEGQNGLRVMQGDCVQGLLGVFWGDGLDVEFFELGVGHGSGAIAHEASAVLGFGERNDLAQGIGPGQQHGEPVEPKSDASVRRRAVAESFQQEAEFRADFFFG